MQSELLLRVDTRVTLDVTKISGASFLYQNTFPDCCFDSCIVSKIIEYKCSDIPNLTEVLKNLHTHVVKEKYMLIIKIHKISIYQKTFKVMKL